MDSVEDAALRALDTLDRFASVNKTLSEEVSFDQYPTNANTKWGSASTIYSGDSMQGEGGG